MSAPRPDRRLDRLFDAARTEQPLLPRDRAQSLLSLVDDRRATDSAMRYLYGSSGLATAAIGFSVGIASVLLVVNHRGAGPDSDIVPRARFEHASPLVPAAPPPSPYRAAPHRFAASQPAEPRTPALTIIADDRSVMQEPVLPVVHRGTVPGWNALLASARAGNWRSPVGVPLMREPQFPIESSVGEENGVRFFTEGGGAFSSLRGGLHNGFTGASGTPQNFGAPAGAWGYQAAAGISMPVSDWIRAAASIRIAEVRAKYASPDIAFVGGQAGGRGSIPVQLTHTESISIGAVYFEPSVRLAPFGGPVFLDGGLSLGALYRQAATYATAVADRPPGADEPQLAAPETRSSIGAARLQYDVRLGIGAELALAPAVRASLAVNAQYGLVPLFADNYPRALLISPSIGLSYLVR